MKDLLFLFLAVTVSLGARAKEIDLSTMSDPAGIFNIAFCARPSPDATGKPGHAFVSFSHMPHGGQRDFLAIGHTVSAGVGAGEATWSYFGSPVSGVLQEEKYTSIKQQCLDVQVNKTDYDQARALTTPALQLMGITRPGGTVFQAYKLGAEDCMTFMIKVANVLKPRGLNVPARGATEAPMAYMQRFIMAN
jgi:hypothetical protein